MSCDHPIPGTQRHTKFDPKKVSPFPIKQVLSHHHFRLDLPPNLYSDDLFDISQLEPAPKERDLFNCSLNVPSTTDCQGVTHFKVKAIVGQQHFRNYNQYHVKWHGDPHTTWEFEEDLLEDSVMGPDGCAGKLDSYEETMHNNRGSGRRRVPTEFSEIGRIDGPMTELVGIGRNKVLLQSSVGSVVPHSYNRPHRNWFEEASIANPARGGQWARKGSPPDEVGALHDDEIGVRRWAPTSGGR
ncbi:uncharacterized protein UBRO_20427 [Ustilago bromivora]|uniref:Chromo domain-containing protein n=1 Tax=Ustilago bromivora TaxID=307758 RepID=A0A1K0GHU0_9BASI|nr:uncharacterized protein UBRO_20427 [Ustilago bromivora]